MFIKCRIFRWLSALACLGLAVLALSASPRSIATTVQRVADGDTITAISANGTKLHIRLLGMDAPEISHGSKPGQPFGPLDTGDREA